MKNHAQAPAIWEVIYDQMRLIYAVVVQKVRKNDRNALVGLMMTVMQTVLLVGMFYVMFSLLGMRSSAIRGDFVLYLLSGIFLFMTFNATMSAVMGAEGATATMMLHAPLNSVITITASALAALYTQLLSLSVVLGIYALAWGPITIDDPFGAASMVLLSWFAGGSVGLVFFAIKPWAPQFISIIHQIYSRANMLASGKMFLANTMPGYIIAWFDWNPLFHTIDQARGFTFANYNPHYSTIAYPLAVSLVLMVLGMICEYGYRKNASLSWSAGK
ncbi:MAG: ABC transporter permease [Mangrovicoccus sp.]